jgi:hypothetical protein
MPVDGEPENVFQFENISMGSFAAATRFWMRGPAMRRFVVSSGLGQTDRLLNRGWTEEVQSSVIVIQ